jgi:DNA polymerase-3 subunit delta
MSSGPKLVVLDDADSFISQQRDKLEGLAQRKNLSGLLILLSVKSTAGTKLHRYAVENGLVIECTLPTISAGNSKKIDESRINKWVIARAKQQHGFTLAIDAATLLKELCGHELGRIEQELAKLALSISSGQTVNQETVRTIVGGWRTETMWTAIDTAVDGDAASSLRMLDKLFRNEESALALFGQISWSLRRYVQAYQLLESARLSGTKLDRREALLKAGFRGYGDELQRAEARMQRLGGTKLQQLGDWLLAADQQLKGSHSHESRGRLVLEKLVFHLADPRRMPTRTPATAAS